LPASPGKCGCAADFLVPYINGEPYSHKPPLLFWLIQLGWGLFGVTTGGRAWWAVVAFASVPMLLRSPRLLWPQPDAAGETAAHAIGLGAVRHAAVSPASSQLTMFDLLLMLVRDGRETGVLTLAAGRARRRIDLARRRHRPGGFSRRDR